MVIHQAKEVTMYGETRIKSLCGRARADVISAETIERGQNVTRETAKVSCSFCRRILKSNGVPNV